MTEFLRKNRGSEIPKFPQSEGPALNGENYTYDKIFREINRHEIKFQRKSFSRFFSTRYFTLCRGERTVISLSE